MKLQKKVEEPEIPTASMADIAFLLIVFFMLTTVFSANKGVEHLLPDQDEEQDDQDNEEAIYIQVFPGKEFELDGEHKSMDQVEEVFDYVMGKVQTNAKKPIILHTNREASYGDFIKILDQIKKVEFELKRSVALTIPSKEEAERYARFGIQN